MSTIQLTLGSIRIAQGALLIQYEVANDGSECAYVFNHVIDRWGLLGEPPLLAPTDELAQMCYGGARNLFIYLGRVSPHLGTDRRIYRPPMPSAIRVEPGEAAQALLRAPLPLCEWSLHFPPAQTRHEGTEDVTIERLRLEAECVLEGEVEAVAEVASGLFQLRDRRSLTIAAEIDVTELGIVLRTSSDMPRFASRPWPPVRKRNLIESFQFHDPDGKRMAEVRGDADPELIDDLFRIQALGLRGKALEQVIRLKLRAAGEKIPAMEADSTQPVQKKKRAPVQDDETRSIERGDDEASTRHFAKPLPRARRKPAAADAPAAGPAPKEGAAAEETGYFARPSKPHADDQPAPGDADVETRYFPRR